MKEFLGEWKQRVRELKTQVYALYLADQEQRVPRYAKVFTALVVGYAFRVNSDLVWGLDWSIYAVPANSPLKRKIQT